MSVERHIVTDEELVRRCLDDDRSYQEMLYRKYADKMYGVCMTYAKDRDDAADILQEGFIQVFRSLGSFRFDSPLEPWIRRVMVNKALEFYRKRQRQREVMDDLATKVVRIADDAIEQIKAEELVKLVNELPEKAAMILKLYAIEGYAHKEIASMMDISEGTSKSQLNRARTLLKQKIEANNVA